MASIEEKANRPSHSRMQKECNINAYPLNVMVQNIANGEERKPLQHSNFRMHQKKWLTPLWVHKFKQWQVEEKESNFNVSGNHRILNSYYQSTKIITITYPLRVSSQIASEKESKNLNVTDHTFCSSKLQQLKWMPTYLCCSLHERKRESYLIITGNYRMH